MHTTPSVRGKFLEVGGQRFLVKGVTYGTFAPDASGRQFPPLARIDQDFAMMAAAGANTVRVYTVPPPEVLDAASRHDLHVIVGVPWAQHVAFLDDAALARDARQRVVDGVRQVAGHPATLLVAVGNEIPPGIVRWHGPRRIGRFLATLFEDAKQCAPDTLLAYVNFPPTEFLDTSLFDVCAFNVYLHRPSDLQAYLRRLQHVAGTKPLLLAEAGADSMRQGLDEQARLTALQVRAAFDAGAAGAVAFAWTDEWWRGGHPVEDWAFGLVDADRRPKPALAAVSRAFADGPFAEAVREAWPAVSVVVCAYNSEDTIHDCLTSLEALRYPHVELIVVDDGSTDATAGIVRGFPGVRLVSIPNGGLAAARNVGLARAAGDIVAYTDADARVDPDWLTYLVQPMLTSDVVGSGGPNVVPPDDDWVAQCVARAPGGPTHVLLDDRVAEHVPGCNMAFRREALAAIDGFNPVYRRAGDDVDICWRLQAKGHTIGFAPAALVWHHHRNSVSAYWRQQVGYGEGESWLDAHHPEKFLHGQMLWHGRIYSPLPFVRALSGIRVNTGVWGTAAFPSIYSTECHPLQFLPHSLAWLGGASALVLGGLLALATTSGDAGGIALGIGLVGWGVTIARCIAFALSSDLTGIADAGVHGRARGALRYRALIAWLHVLQPVARAVGRLRGLMSPPAVGASSHATGVPWKAPGPSVSSTVTAARLQFGGTTEWAFWSESWLSSGTVLTALASSLRAVRPARRVDIDDGWHLDRDLSMAIGRWGWLVLRALVEEHAQGRCLVRVGARLQPSLHGFVRAVVLAVLLVGTTSAGIALRWPSVSLATAVAALGLLASAAWQVTRSLAILERALGRTATQHGLLALPARTTRRHHTLWRPAPSLQKSQTAMVLVLTTSLAVSGLLLWLSA